MPVPFLPFVASISVSTKISLCIFGTIVLALMFIKQILKRKEIRVNTDHWVTVPMAEAKSEPVRVAVVGSGVGAAATCYNIRSLFAKGSDVSLTVFEMGNGSAGPIVDFDGEKYEAGHSIVADYNQTIKRLCLKMEVPLRPVVPGNQSIMLHTGSYPSFQSMGRTLMDMLSTVWRYGIQSPIEMRQTTSGCVLSFSNIYLLQQHGYVYDEPLELLKGMGADGDDFTSIIDKDARDYFITDRCIKAPLVDDLCTASLRYLYGLDCKSVNGLCANIAMADIEYENLYTPVGGADAVSSALLEDSKARVVAGRTVTAASRTESGAFVLDGDDEANEFDAVVLAMPVEEAEKLSLKGPDGKAIGLFNDCNCEVKKLYHHFVQGTVSPSITKVAGRVPVIVSTTQMAADNNLPWTSIEAVVPVGATTEEAETALTRAASGHVSNWKVTAQEKLGKEELQKLVMSLPGAPEPVVVETNCPTFPVNDKLPPFKLSEGVFSTAAMTRTADDLEMACIGARNSALLVRKYLLDENLIEAPTGEAPEPLEEGPKPLE
ncbi:Prenylcysteine oxidase precursor, putative [Perkinsus marinus ATCC 50983]|uniref:Prenylcysteine oxidase, putative n=1 Tax=Perkinsus marinus (strain ATCC 50983 / TXsc) TaxID=423536 RepID=C5L1B1_PERM5|nr:Prenylcysteine oxidase precursor, putative [Perkinsus marinus ATCC 50983]EER09518.1 Prenylcysteine oxidase precursor, putative [Perkinsus marinus ATCC 50983]|eukprot:XP_002777702.1 Prenylcysteine oxidase precursor, putative [Perkinsus marinus ATCC 50983]